MILKWKNKIRNVQKDSYHHWVAIPLGGFTLMGMYANCPQYFTERIWDLIKEKVEVPIMLIGDLNMVKIAL